MSMSGARKTKVKVWDLALRVFHWLLAVGFFVAYFSAAAPAVHIWAGYGVLGLLCFRLIWGVIGPQFARFSDMLYGPIALLRYVWRALTFRAKEYYLGYSPAGGLMAIALIVCLLLTTWSGVLLYGAASQQGPLAWLMQAANPGSVAGLTSLHGFAAWLSVVLIVTHLAVAFWESLLQHNNLFFAMISGRQYVHGASSLTPNPSVDASTVQIPGYDVWVDPAAIIKVDLGRTDAGQPQVKLMVDNENQPRVFLFSERRQALKFYQTIWALKNNYYSVTKADSQPIA